MNTETTFVLAINMACDSFVLTVLLYSAWMMWKLKRMLLNLSSTSNSGLTFVDLVSRKEIFTSRLTIGFAWCAILAFVILAFMYAQACYRLYGLIAGKL